jgi:transcription-repair coupling factor (superfamily II helicase)
VAEEWLPEVELGVPATLPADYVPEPEVRLEIYERLAKLAEPGAIDDLAEELDDRFGEPPPAAVNLLAAARLRLRWRELGIARLDVGPKAAAVTPRDPAAATAASSLRRSGERLLLERSTATDEERLAVAHDLLDALGFAHAA